MVVSTARSRMSLLDEDEGSAPGGKLWEGRSNALVALRCEGRQSRRVEPLRLEP